MIKYTNFTKLRIMINIKNLYSYDHIYSLTDIIRLVNQTKLYNDKYIKLAINELLLNGNAINRKIYDDTRPGSDIVSSNDMYKDYIVIDKNNIEGYLIKATGKEQDAPDGPDGPGPGPDNIYCIFQPLNLKSTDVTMYDRINNLFVPKICNKSYSAWITATLICATTIHAINNVETITPDFFPPKNFLSIAHTILVMPSEISAGRKISSSGISFTLSANKSNNGNNENKKTWIGNPEIFIFLSPNEDIISFLTISQ